MRELREVGMSAVVAVYHDLFQHSECIVIDLGHFLEILELRKDLVAPLRAEFYGNGLNRATAHGSEATGRSGADSDQAGGARRKPPHREEGSRTAEPAREGM